MISHFHGSRFWNPFHFNVKTPTPQKRESPPHIFSFLFYNKIKKKSLGIGSQLSKASNGFSCSLFLCIVHKLLCVIWPSVSCCTWNKLYKGRETHTHTIQTRNILHTHTHTETDSAGPAIISWVITYGENETSFPFSLVDSGWPFLPSFLPSTGSCVCV